MVSWRQKLKLENPEKYKQMLQQQRDYMKEYLKDNYNPENHRKANHKHYEKNKGSLIEKQRVWRAMNPEQYKTHIKLSRIPMPKNTNCELCPDDDKQGAIQRHHPDYNYPLIFIYCCWSCHRWLEK